jgi:GT2 family glycosyltransferase
MDLSIIIVNWNTRDYLKDCLKSILENIKEVSFEVIVVDNNSSDGSAEMVKDEFPHVKLIASDINTCFAKGNNIGYEISDGDYIAFLNPDTIIYPNTCETTVTYLKTYSKVGAVSCKFMNPDGSFQRGYHRRFPNISTVFFCFTPFGSFIDINFFKKKYENIYFYNDKKFDKIEKIDQPGATFMVVPRVILEKVGIFDEKFPLLFNDVDLCKRIWKAGFEIHLLPYIAITHYGGRGVKQLGWAVHKHFFVGCYRYFRKHHGIAPALLVSTLLLTNLLPLFAAPVVNIISEYISNVKEYGMIKTNKKAVRFIVKNIKPMKEKK